MFHFGSGTLWGVQNAVNGVTTANPPAHLFGTLQDVSLDVQFDTKELYGRKQFPDAIARGKGKVTGKAKFANISGAILNDLFFGQTNSVPMSAVANGEAGSIPATPFQVTVVNSATFLLDLGVMFTATGIELKRVASAPTTGQYSVAAGVYTFAAADTLLAVQISYVYAPAATGNKTTIVNQLMGKAPTFTVVLSDDYNSKQANLKLFNCIASKLTWATKTDDFLIPEFDFMAFADASGNVFELSTTE